MIKYITRLFKELQNPTAFQKNPVGRELLRALEVDGNNAGLLAVHKALLQTAETLYVNDMLDEQAQATAAQRYGIIIDDLRGAPAQAIASHYRLNLRQFFRERLYCRRRIVEHLLSRAHRAATSTVAQGNTRFSAWCDVAEKFLTSGVPGDAMVALAYAAQIASELALVEETIDLHPIQRRLFDLYEATLSAQG